MPAAYEWIHPDNSGDTPDSVGRQRWLPCTTCGAQQLGMYTHRVVSRLGLLHLHFCGDVAPPQGDGGGRVDSPCLASLLADTAAAASVFCYGRRVDHDDKLRKKRARELKKPAKVGKKLRGIKAWSLRVKKPVKLYLGRRPAADMHRSSGVVAAAPGEDGGGESAGVYRRVGG